MSMHDLENMNKMNLEAIARKIIGFFLAIASIGLTALVFVLITRHKDEADSPADPHGFGGQE